MSYTARLPLSLALRDAFGYLDLYYDFLRTLRGKGMSYRSFEPSGAEWGVVREGRGRERRLRDGLRYEGGGKDGKKYWLPGSAKTDADEILRQAALGHPAGGGTAAGYGATGVTSPVGFGVMRHGHGPHSQAYRSPPIGGAGGAGAAGASYFPLPADNSDDSDDDGGSVSSLAFSDPPSPTSSSGGGGSGRDNPRRHDRSTPDDEALYAEARGYLHGDWAYTVIDVSKEAAKRAMREEEENVLRGRGRRGEGRRVGERWGRGPAPPGGEVRPRKMDEGAPALDRSTASTSTAAAGGKKGKTRSYGAYHDAHEDDTVQETPSSRPHGGSGSSSDSTETAVVLGNDEDDDPSLDGVRKQWTTTTKQVARGLKAVASKVVPPPPHLRFDTDELRRSGALSPHSAAAAGGGARSRSGSRPTSPGTGQGELPPDAVRCPFIYMPSLAAMPRNAR